MAGGGKGKKTQTSSVSVPEYLDRELQYGVGESRRLYDQGAPTYFPGSTYAGFTPAQMAAQSGTLQRAADGSPLVGAAQDLTQQTINGDFLNGSPYLDDLLARYGAKANSMVQGGFNKSGRLGSGANVATATQAVGDSVLPYLFSNYQAERGMQQNAAAMAPTLAAEDYKDLAAMSSVGEAQQAQDQLGINDAMSRYDYEANAEGNWLNEYLNRINSSKANDLKTTTQTQSGGGGLGSALGSALGIASMFVPGGQFAGLGGLASFGSKGLSFGGLGQSIGSLFSSSPMGPYQPFGVG